MFIHTYTCTHTSTCDDNSTLWYVDINTTLMLHVLHEVYNTSIQYNSLLCYYKITSRNYFRLDACTVLCITVLKLKKLEEARLVAPIGAATNSVVVAWQREHLWVRARVMHEIDPGLSPS